MENKFDSILIIKIVKNSFKKCYDIGVHDKFQVFLQNFI